MRHWEGADRAAVPHGHEKRYSVRRGSSAPGSALASLSAPKKFSPVEYYTRSWLMRSAFFSMIGANRFSPSSAAAAALCGTRSLSE
jgi:hypothetical protein